MSKIVDQVTPLTRGIIWLTKDESNISNPHYQDIDYLLDGLLTKNLQASSAVSSKVLVGKNFGNSLFVMIVKEIIRNEVESFVTLIKSDLGPENDVIVIDEWDGLSLLNKEAKDIQSNLRTIK